MERFEQIPLATLHASKTNPRKHFDDKQLAELILSIKEKGIVVPILVRPVKDGMEVVAGERRFRASKELKLKEVPCIVRDLTDEQALEIQVIENLQRADVHPLDEAAGFAQLIGKGKHTPEIIAEKVGKSPTWVKQSLKLNDLIPEIKQSFWDGKLNRTQGIYLSSYPVGAQKKVYEKVINRKSEFTLSDLKDEIEEHQIDLHKGNFDKQDATLVPKAGACAVCPKRSGFTPELFPDVKKKDMCLDTTCFAAKLKAHAVRQIEEIEDRGEKVVAIQGESFPRIKTGATKKVIDRWGYVEVTGKNAVKEKGTVKAVVTEDDDPSRIGKTMIVRIQKRGEMGGGGSGGGSRQSNRPSKTELFKRKIEREAVKRIIVQILEKVNVPQLSQKVFAHFVEDIAGGYMSNGTVEFYKEYLGYTDLKATYGSNKALAKRIHNPKTSIGELHKIALVGLIFKRFQAGSYDDFADLLKVDASGIRAKVKTEMEAARKEKEAKKGLVSPMTQAIREQKALAKKTEGKLITKLLAKPTKKKPSKKKK